MKTSQLKSRIKECVKEVLKESNDLKNLESMAKDFVSKYGKVKIKTKL